MHLHILLDNGLTCFIFFFVSLFKLGYGQQPVLDTVLVADHID